MAAPHLATGRAVSMPPSGLTGYCHVQALSAGLVDRETADHIFARHHPGRRTEQEIKAGKRRGNAICADDFVIADIGVYRDLTEFQYDIRGNEVFFRRLDGWWPESLKNAAEFKRLTAKGVVSRRTEKPSPYHRAIL